MYGMDMLSKRWRKFKGRNKKVNARRTQAAQAALKRKRDEASCKRKKIDTAGTLTSAAEKIHRNGSDPHRKVLTASRRKIELFQDSYPSSVLQESDNLNGDFVLISRKTLQSAFKAVTCTACNNKSMKLILADRKGFCDKLVVQCEVCEKKFFESWSSDRLKNKTSQRPPFAVNKLMTEAFLSVGLGHAAMETFFSTLGMNSMSHMTFKSHLKSIYEDMKLFKIKILSEARKMVRDAYIFEDESLKLQDTIDIIVSFDGTWQKRGFTSLYGMGFVIDFLTGLVIDFEILSKYCYICLLAEKSYDLDTAEYQEWSTKHLNSGTCNRNYSGSSPAMETESAGRLWQRSVSDTGFRYGSVLSDGDAKTFKHLESLKPYGSDYELKKEECLNHVSKRLYAGLKKIVSECKVKRITLGGTGEGQLTERVMSKLAQYYRLAVERNLNDVQAMKNSIMATLYHCSSTDKKPKHHLCPEGEESWCFFQKAKAMNRKPSSHSGMSTRLNSTVMKHILPLYERLSDETLLERCQRGGTQNVNECLHSVIWHKVPKEVFVSRTRMEVGVVNAIAEFNMGRKVATQMKHQSRGTAIPAVSVHNNIKQDQLRIRRSEGAVTRFQRKQKRQENADREKAQKKKEGQTYQPGGF